MSIDDNNAANKKVFDMKRPMTRRRALLLGGSAAAAAILAGLGIAFGSGGGSIGGGSGGGGYLYDMYKTTYCFDNSGFVQDGEDPTQGWEKDSIDYFWRLLEDEVRRVIPTASGRLDVPGSSNYELYHSLIDNNPSLGRFLDAGWSMPRKVFYALATQALDRARSRIDGRKARVIGFGCVYGSNADRTEWQFLNVSANLQSQNGYYYNFFPAGVDPRGRTTLSLTLPDRGDAIGLIGPEYIEGWSGTLWDSDASVDASDGNIGSNPGESWRDYIYRRAILDTNGELGTVAIIAVSDKEPKAKGSITISKTCNDDTTRDFSFKLTLPDNINGQYGDMNFTNGVATFTLKHNQSKTASNLPFDITYSVDETSTGVSATWTNKSGRITSANPNITVTCNNITEAYVKLTKKSQM